MSTKYWVSMHDKFFSGWGHARDKISIFMVKCKTLEQAEQVEKFAETEACMKRVRIHQCKPYFSKKRYHVQTKKFRDLGKIWRGDVE